MENNVFVIFIYGFNYKQAHRLPTECLCIACEDQKQKWCKIKIRLWAIKLLLVGREKALAANTDYFSYKCKNNSERVSRLQSIIPKEHTWILIKELASCLCLDLETAMNL